MKTFLDSISAIGAPSEMFELRMALKTRRENYLKMLAENFSDLPAETQTEIVGWIKVWNFHFPEYTIYSEKLGNIPTFIGEEAR